MEIYTIKKTKMKRERLFKAKRVDNGEWVFGYLIKKQLHNKFDSPPSLMYEKWYIDKGSDINLFDGIFHQVEVHPETVCQLFNCGSGDFYEDDKVFYNGKEYVVKFHLSFATLERNMVQHGENESVFINEDVAYIMKLTGNIHD